jgi:hypothetical protein
VPTAVWAGLAALLLLGGTVWYCSEQVEDRVEQAETIGEEREKTKQYEKTIEKVEKANEAREEITRPGPVGDRTRYNQCLRTARTPENCKRFLPELQEDQR